MRLFDRVRRPVLFSVLLLASPLPAGENREHDAQVRRLIEQLDDDDFARRSAATARLLEVGEAALPLLHRAAASGPPEVRYRARRIIYVTVTLRIRRDLADLATAKKDEQIDVERGMWLICRIVDPLVKKKQLDRQLDELAMRVRKRLKQELGDDIEPKQAPPAAAVAALRHVLFNESGFDGNTRDYSNPANSSLDQVLKTRRGLPILLSHVVMAVARRSEIPIVGLALPGRYMCMYDGSRSPGGASANIIIDPFGAGRVLSRKQLHDVIRSVDPEAKLEPDGNRSALVRMLVNLASHYGYVGNEAKAAEVYEYRQLLIGDTGDP